MRAAVIAVAVVLIGGPAQSDPSAAIAQARELLAKGDCRAAAGVLENAVKEAGAVSNDAVAAIHFHAATAHQRCGRIGEAREHLKQFFVLHPGVSKLDPKKFEPAFVRLFDEVQNDLHRGGPATFDRFYPGFQNALPSSSSVPALNIWGSSSEFLILATDRERDMWGRLSSDLDRADFISRFWRSRDMDAGTEENEFRLEAQRRVRFADQTFPAADERGALTDRGRIFVLLGPPSRVYREALQRGQTTFVTRSARRPLDGQMERWIYFREQLAGSIPARQVEFRFITQPGYGEGVMEKDFMALKALEEARLAMSPIEE